MDISAPTRDASDEEKGLILQSMILPTGNMKAQISKDRSDIEPNIGPCRSAPSIIPYNLCTMNWKGSF